MSEAIMLLASQALALTAPVAEPAAPGARVSALATVEILRAQTTRDEAGPQVLVRHRRVKAGGRSTIEFE